MSGNMEIPMPRRCIDVQATGRNIRRLRLAAGYSVRQIQECCGLSSPQAVYKWQWGEALPSLDNMALLAWLLDVKMEDILVFSAQRDRSPDPEERK